MVPLAEKFSGVSVSKNMPLCTNARHSGAHFRDRATRWLTAVTMESTETR